MKKLILMLLVCGSMAAQKKVFNVQLYCIDEKPFKKGSCDITGNEYSFVFMDAAKKEVTFFLTQMKLKYEILASNTDEADSQYTAYVLKGENGLVDMRINKKQTKIEFLYPDKKIYLTVGKSTHL